MESDRILPVTQTQDLRKRLIVRIAIAGVLLIAVLVGFQWLERSQRSALHEPPGVQSPVPNSAPASVSTIADAPRQHSAALVNDSLPVATEVVAETAEPKTASAPGQEPATVAGSGSDSARTEPESAVIKHVNAAAQKAAAVSAVQTQLPRGPHLQAGVFGRAANAEEFKARLEAQGLPVYIESRVQIGPFKDREQAEDMREQLKAKGMTTLLIAQ